MAKSRKKKLASCSTKVEGKVKTKPKKKRTANSKKMAHQKGTAQTVAVPKTPTKAPSTSVALMLTKKGKKVTSSQTTPSTVSSKSTRDSKHTVTLMDGLALKSPMAKKRTKTEDVVEASLSDIIDYEDPNMILWLKKQGVVDALEHHSPDWEDYLELDYHEQLLLLVKVFKPVDMRYVLQGLLTDAGMNWRKLKLNKLRIMKVLAPKFAKVCVELFNAKMEFNTSTSVPADIVIGHDKGQKKSPS